MRIAGRRLDKEVMQNLSDMALARLGLQRRISSDFEQDFLGLLDRCSPHTMTSIERMYGLHQAVAYIASAGVKGDFVECGVWEGGSSMLAALGFERLGERSRDFYLYDTFEGMAEPGAEDGAGARAEWSQHQRENGNDWCYAPIDAVRRNMLSTGIDAHRLHLVKGLVEETIPGTMPDEIAILRLDTDWYASTKHELEHLFPRLAKGGVLIIDDYGHWQGSRQAVDEYFAEHDLSILLNRVDYSGRIGVK